MLELSESSIGLAAVPLLQWSVFVLFQQKDADRLGGALSVVRVQCTHCATIWPFGRTRNPYLVMLGASLLSNNGFLMLLLHQRYGIFGFSPNYSCIFTFFNTIFAHFLACFSF